METRASYLIIGIFTLLAIFAGLGFFLWLAKVQIDKTYTQYDILFDQVSGLGQSSPVRFNGVDVGKVLSIALDRADSSQVRVRIEVAATTPVRLGTEATLSAQGVTGVAFVGLDGGAPDAGRLPINPITEVAEIPSKNTPVQSLIADAPDVLKQVASVLDRISSFTTQENADHVTQILANVDDATGRLNKMMADLSKASDSLSGAADRFAAFSGQLDTIAANTNGAVSDARSTMADARKTLTAVQTSLDELRAAVGEARKGLSGINDFATTGLPKFVDLAGQGSRVAQDLSSLISQIKRDPARFFLGNRTPEYNK